MGVTKNQTRLSKRSQSVSDNTFLSLSVNRNVYSSFSLQMIILIPLVSPKTSAGLQAGKNKEGINNPIWIWGNKKINKMGSTLRVEFGSWRPQKKYRLCQMW